MKHCRGIPMRSLGILLLVTTLTLSAYFPVTARGGDAPQRSPIDLIQFLDDHAAKLSPSKNDLYLLQLIDSQSRSIERHEKQLFSDQLNPIINRYSYQALTQLRNIKETQIKTLMSNILADGLKLSTSEGMYYIEINYPQISNRYGKYASKPMTAFLKIMAHEISQHFSEDAGLMIQPDVLAKRIISTELFVAKNSKFPRINEVKELHERYLNAYIIGLNNTPAFDYETNTLDRDFRESYQTSIKKYPGTRLAKGLVEYLKILEQNHYQKTKTVQNYISNPKSF